MVRIQQGMQRLVEGKPYARAHHPKDNKAKLERAVSSAFHGLTAEEDNNLHDAEDASRPSPLDSLRKAKEKIEDTVEDPTLRDVLLSLVGAIEEFVKHVVAFVEHVKTDLDTRDGEMRTHRQSVDTLGGAVAQLTEAQERTETRLPQLTETVASLTEDHREFEKRSDLLFRKLDRRFDVLTETMESIRMGLRRLIERVQAQTRIYRSETEAAADAAIMRILKEHGARGIHYWCFDREGRVFEKGTPVEIQVLSIDPPLVIEFANELTTHDIDLLVKKLEYLRTVEELETPIVKYLTFRCDAEVERYATSAHIEVVRIPVPRTHEEYDLEEE